MRSSLIESAARRRLLAGGASALAAAGLGRAALAAEQKAAPAAAAPPAPASAAKPLPAYAAWKQPDAMIVHSANTIETRREAFGSGVVTPLRQLYVRNNLPPPDESIVADRDAWVLEIAGVAKPMSLSVGQLKSMGLQTLAMVLQCSGNGRGYFPNKPSGTPWQVGAAGCVIWSGLPVSVLVEHCGGLEAAAVYMTGTGGEKLPDGLDPNMVMVERSVPKEAMRDALLAWELNGEPIPLAHGGPLRLIVPGYTGVNSVKYIKRLAFTEKESPAAIQQTGYRLAPPGQKGNPSQPSVWAMGVKSWINTPNPAASTLKAGRVVVQGVAFGGTNGIKQVEVSIDGGKNWQKAELVGPDLGRYAWRQFALPVELAAGEHVLVSRATDTEGRVQEEERPQNSGGYINSSWRDHAVTVVAKA
ncbi:sulfite oxidase [Achromobacter sp. K91]|uniref:TMAO/DMSO reductase n=1 Tax=Achromobacter aegrifaciens TaxID=1287736 RepID=A0AAD2J095_ACHAE|nr:MULTISPECIES: sulfite oxidase [Achromobacter]MBD9473627.1 sulfite oxidase [Achromobacter sp. ACM01]MDQ1760278.1 sulfite oxidase [Achromobacter aegrifaciens]RIJ00640.1 sulfite oxidase [Achromobacter sp. K91]CUJ15612.1 TMAO/DMSO reductase [Achromobacter aegrifaciens]